MSYKEKQSIIREDNLPYCPECGSILGNMKEHGMVTHNGKKYFQFKRYCSNTKCNIIGLYYESDLGKERFVINDVKEVMEEKVELNDLAEK